jgi:hypothetical protein
VFIGRYLAAKAAWSVFLGRYPLPDCPAYAGFLVSLDKEIIDEIDAVLCSFLSVNHDFESALGFLKSIPISILMLSNDVTFVSKHRRYLLSGEINPAQWRGGLVVTRM